MTELLPLLAYRKKKIVADELISMLYDQPKTSNEIFRRFEQLGISSRTVKSVKKELDIVSFKLKNTWYWKLNRGESYED